MSSAVTLGGMDRRIQMMLILTVIMGGALLGVVISLLLVAYITR